MFMRSVFKGLTVETIRQKVNWNHTLANWYCVCFVFNHM